MESFADRAGLHLSVAPGSPGVDDDFSRRGRRRVVSPITKRVERAEAAGGSDSGEHGEVVIEAALKLLGNRGLAAARRHEAERQQEQQQKLASLGVGTAHQQPSSPLRFRGGIGSPTHIDTLATPHVAGGAAATPREVRAAWEDNRRFVAGLNHEALQALRLPAEMRTPTQAAFVLAWLKTQATSAAAAPLFRSLFHLPFAPDEAMTALCDSLRLVSYPKGCTIFEQGDDADTMYYILHGNVHVYHRAARSNDAGFALVQHSKSKQVEAAAEAAAKLTREHQSRARTSPDSTTATASSGGRARHRRSAIRGSVMSQVQGAQVAEVSEDTGLFIGYLPAGAPLGFCSSLGRIHDITAVSGGLDGGLAEADLYREASETVTEKFVAALQRTLRADRMAKAAARANSGRDEADIHNVVDVLRIDMLAYLRCSRRWFQRQRMLLKRRARLLRRVRALEHMPAVEVLFLSQWMHEQRHSYGDIVQAEGDGANTITFVLGGAVGLFSWEKGSHTAGETLCVHIEQVVAPGFFGGACHVLRATRTSTRRKYGYESELQVNAARCLSSCLLGFLPACVFRAMMLSEEADALFRTRRKLLTITLQRDEWRDMRVANAATTGQMPFPLLSHVQDLVIDNDLRGGGDSVKVSKSDARVLAAGFKTALDSSPLHGSGSDDDDSSDAGDPDGARDSDSDDGLTPMTRAIHRKELKKAKIAAAFARAHRVQMLLLRFIIKMRAVLQRSRARAAQAQAQAQAGGSSSPRVGSGKPHRKPLKSALRQRRPTMPQRSPSTSPELAGDLIPGEMGDLTPAATATGAGAGVGAGASEGDLRVRAALRRRRRRSADQPAPLNPLRRTGPGSPQAQRPTPRGRLRQAGAAYQPSLLSPDDEAVAQARWRHRTQGATVHGSVAPDTDDVVTRSVNHTQPPPQRQPPQWRTSRGAKSAPRKAGPPVGAVLGGARKGARLGKPAHRRRKSADNQSASKRAGTGRGTTAATAEPPTSVQVQPLSSPTSRTLRPQSAHAARDRRWWQGGDGDEGSPKPTRAPSKSVAEPSSPPPIASARRAAPSDPLPTSPTRRAVGATDPPSAPGGDFEPPWTLSAGDAPPLAHERMLARRGVRGDGSAALSSPPVSVTAASSRTRAQPRRTWVDTAAAAGPNVVTDPATANLAGAPDPTPAFSARKPRRLQPLAGPGKARSPLAATSEQGGTTPVGAGSQGSLTRPGSRYKQARQKASWRRGHRTLAEQRAGNHQSPSHALHMAPLPETAVADEPALLSEVLTAPESQATMRLGATASRSNLLSFHRVSSRASVHSARALESAARLRSKQSSTTSMRTHSTVSRTSRRSWASTHTSHTTARGGVVAPAAGASVGAVVAGAGDTNAGDDTNAGGDTNAGEGSEGSSPHELERRVSFAPGTPARSPSSLSRAVSGLQMYKQARLKEAHDASNRVPSITFVRTQTTLRETLPHEDAAFKRVFNQFHDSDSPAATPTPADDDASDTLHDIGTHVEVLGEVDSDDEVGVTPAHSVHRAASSARAGASSASVASVATHKSLRRRSTAERLLEDQAQQQSLSRLVRRASSRKARAAMLARKGSSGTGTASSHDSGSATDVKALLSAALASPAPGQEPAATHTTADAMRGGVRAEATSVAPRDRRGLTVAVDSPMLAAGANLPTPQGSPATGPLSRSSGRLSARALGAAAAASSRRLRMSHGSMSGSIGCHDAS